jgi:GNAT superfamily N-acetyltransferase
MEALTIRQAVSSDIPTLMALDHGYSTDHVWQMAFDRTSGQIDVTFREVRLPRPMRVGYPRDPERLADEWTRRAVILVAQLDEDVRGYLSIIDGPAPETAWITDLVVALRYRRQGIASHLLKAARAWCRERDMVRLYVEMQSKNYPAIALFGKGGFVFSGYSDNFYPDQDIALFFSQELY